MTGTRKTFGRVDTIVALLEPLKTAETLDGVQVVDAWPGQAQQNECIWPGTITGQVGQPVSAAGRTRDQDEFTVPFHISAENVAAQPTSMSARVRCEALMTAVRDTLATVASLPKVPGVLDVVTVGADGPDAEPVVDPAGWVAYATVRVRVRIRMI